MTHKKPPVLYAATMALSLFAAAVHAGPAATPPMGWNPWNAFRTEVTEAKIMGVAQKLVDSGLAQAGYRYVNVDDGWWLKRGADDRLQIRTSMFPSADAGHGETSFKPFVDRLHGMGLKAGLYTDLGRNACSQAWDAKSPNLPVGTVAEREVGSFGHQAGDMRRIFGDWGFDYIKVDACGLADFTPDKAFVRDGQFRALGPYILRGHPTLENDTKVEALYASLNDAIAAVRPKGDYVLSICSWGEGSVANWGRLHGNLWRTSADINPSWASMLANFDSAAIAPDSAGPGHWNDPDMLEIGNGAFDANHLTEARSQMSMWAIISAPLLLGSDITQWPQSLIDIAGNRDVIAIDQDPAGHQGIIVAKTDESEILVKTLAQPGAKAVALINRSAHPVTLSLPLSQLDLGTAKLSIEDVWTHKPQPAEDGTLTVALAAHETALLLVKAQR